MAVHAPITGAPSRAPFAFTQDDLTAKFSCGIEADATILEIRAALRDFRARYGIDPRTFRTAGGAA